VGPPRETIGAARDRYRRSTFVALAKVLRAVFAPLLVGGIAVAFSLLGTYASGGRLWLLPGLFCVVAVLVVEYRRRLPGAQAVWLPLYTLVGVLFIPMATEVWVLEGRGIEAACTVTDIRYTSPRLVENVMGYSYDYSLACPGGHTTAIGLDTRPKEVGESLQVAYDPDKRVSSMRAEDVHDHGHAWVAGLALAGSVVLRLRYASR